MKHYTSIEQSKKLLELGLSPESADMWYSLDETDPEYNVLHIDESLDWDEITVYDRALPCWSVGALMSVMDPEVEANLVYERNKFFVVYRGRHYQGSTGYSYDSPIDALFEMICYLLEENYINKKGDKH